MSEGDKYNEIEFTSGNSTFIMGDTYDLDIGSAESWEEVRDALAAMQFVITTYSDDDYQRYEKVHHLMKKRRQL